MKIIIVGVPREGKTCLANVLRPTIEQFVKNAPNDAEVIVESTNGDIIVDGFIEHEYKVRGFKQNPYQLLPIPAEILETKPILGATATDKVTGFTGIVIAECAYLTGSTQYCIVGKSIDNKPADSCWFDTERVEFED